MDNRLVTTCHYYQGEGVHCYQGTLMKYRTLDGGPDLDGVIAEPIKLEGLPLQCPACEGRGVIPTEYGRDMVQFLQTYAYPTIKGMVREIIEEGQGC